ncbi:bluetail domain-containing putative surface protein, partial [Nostoc sp. FACHB-152]
LALNDGVDGFSALTDAVVEITGYKGNLANLAVV